MTDERFGVIYSAAMKTKSLLLSFGIFATFFGSLSSAQAFLVDPVVTVTPAVVEATVCNNFAPVPVLCEITSYGLLNTGIWVNASAVFTILPGACDASYVYATPPFYFISGNGVANCQ